jgi:hypothetical protein
VLLFSPLPLLRDFGAIVAITIAIALLSAVIVLPPLLLWADERDLLRLPSVSSVAGRGGEAVPGTETEIDIRADAEMEGSDAEAIAPRGG